MFFPWGDFEKTESEMFEANIFMSTFAQITIFLHRTLYFTALQHLMHRHQMARGQEEEATQRYFCHFFTLKVSFIRS